MGVAGLDLGVSSIWWGGGPLSRDLLVVDGESGAEWTTWCRLEFEFLSCQVSCTWEGLCGGGLFQTALGKLVGGGGERHRHGLIDVVSLTWSLRGRFLNVDVVSF